MNNSIKHVIFDWDGTIQDTISNIVAAWQGASTELSLAPLSAVQIKSMIGLSLHAGIGKVEPNLSEAGIEAFIECYRKHYFALEAQPSPLYRAIPELMEQLRTQGQTLTVGTGKGRQGLDRTLASSGISQHFSATRTACETASKPSPLMVQTLCEQVGIAPAQTMMVGDAYFDMAMARNAGAVGVGVSYGAGTIEELQRAQPLAIIGEPLALLNLL
ncbi:HAD family hydrolase [Ferrimonas lipolytica]|uniref:HAD-IA family hydrolase n=1 Tax=Ferrimonas lipolytica TaxID=2724191 RepID=A0A6H1UCF9_9GAMM|nr:HAD-IA family hydrolase [Ferrimonas lipolytica]QIZ76043.1 HAD-IA family hydrolase [Ferrimonas lipolytica]